MTTSGFGNSFSAALRAHRLEKSTLLALCVLTGQSRSSRWRKKDCEFGDHRAHHAAKCDSEINQPAMFGTQVALTIWAVGNATDTAHMSAFDAMHPSLAGRGPSTYEVGCASNHAIEALRRSLPFTPAYTLR
jgi:hypothetical protein